MIQIKDNYKLSLVKSMFGGAFYLNILVTQTSAFASDSLIRLIKRIDNAVVFGCDPLSYNMNSVNQLVYKFFQTPRIDEPKEYIQSINTICDLNKIDLVIPVMDNEIRMFTKYQELINFKIILPDQTIVDLFHDKQSASIAIKDIGIQIPKIITDLRNESKVIFRDRIGIGSHGIYIVDLKTAQYIENRFNNNTFIQEYLCGDEYTVDVMTDKNGIPKIILPRKRITIINGLSYRCQIIKQDRLIELCKKIYSEFLIPGLSNVQFIVCDGEPFFIELNTRFAATGIAGIMASYNYISQFLEHFVLKNEIETLEMNMKDIAWNSIITRYYGETISKFE